MAQRCPGLALLPWPGVVALGWRCQPSSSCLGLTLPTDYAGDPELDWLSGS
jgi:hypothetical protein